MSNSTPDAPQRSPVLRMIGWTRYIALIAVFGTFLGSALLLVIGSVELFSAIFAAIEALGEPHLSEAFKIALIESVDTFLVAVVLLIIALGLYQLFVGPIDRLPPWLEAHSVNDLEKRLTGMVVTVLSVIFLTQVVQWQSGLDILWIGLAIGVVVLAISVFLYQESRHDHKG
ncbi:YqhA family protein [Caldilinea sp.]|uniref:YqhA family protein n=1 Tax=Caldilinea sp. TaxID=2293560 RepID=UPI002C7A92FD|nr:YqhA family protein [Anaerolineales bacterium]HQY94302.1 YqhA family protein [Caldilinea sp.]HRA65896.1 YqhA family protein [Caldilinea sp.]